MSLPITVFRLYLMLAWTALVIFTIIVVGRDGMSLLPVFFGAIRDGHWPGQFNADFLSLLILSGLWTGWRNEWTPLGCLLALGAFFGGGGFLMLYLLVLLTQERGDMYRVLLNRKRIQEPSRRWTD